MKETSREYDQKHIDDLMTLSQSIVSEKYLKDILQLIVTVVGNVADFDVCFLWLMDESQCPEKIRLAASHGPVLEDMGQHPFSLHEKMAGFVTGRKEPVVIPDLLAEERFEKRAIAERSELRSMLGVPLKAPDGTPIGALTCFTTTPHEFSREEIDRMSAAAAKATITLIDTALMVKTRVAQEELKTFELVGKARELLMRRQGIGADEAWNRIRHYSTESLNSPRRVAETILLSDAMGCHWK